jgi:hypothetical protein
MKAGFQKRKNKIFSIWSYNAQIPDDTNYTVLFSDMVSINSGYLIIITGTVFNKIAIFCLGAHLKGTYFLELECSGLTKDG